jgi:hypothetical protein
MGITVHEMDLAMYSHCRLTCVTRDKPVNAAEQSSGRAHIHMRGGGREIQVQDTMVWKDLTGSL